MPAKKLYPDLKVIPGEEITTGIIAKKKIEVTAYFISEKIARNQNLGVTIREIKRQNGIVGIPHPFELWRHGAGEQMADRIIQIAIEEGVPVLVEVFNSRSTRENNDKARGFFEREKEKYPEAYKQHKLLAIAGSDAHTPGEIGRGGVFLLPWKTQQEFLDNLALAENMIWGEDNRTRTIFHRGITHINQGKAFLASHFSQKIPSGKK